MRNLFLIFMLIGYAGCSSSIEKFPKLTQMPQGTYTNIQEESIIIKDSTFTVNDNTTTTEFQIIAFAFVCINDSEQIYSFTVKAIDTIPSSGILKRFFGYQINEKSPSDTITFKGKGYISQ